MPPQLRRLGVVAVEQKAKSAAVTETPLVPYKKSTKTASFSGPGGFTTSSTASSFGSFGSVGPPQSQNFSPSGSPSESDDEDDDDDDDDTADDAVSLTGAAGEDEDDDDELALLTASLKIISDDVELAYNSRVAELHYIGASSAQCSTSSSSSSTNPATPLGMIVVLPQY